MATEMAERRKNKKEKENGSQEVTKREEETERIEKYEKGHHEKVSDNGKK
jgi:hypothetical protein